MSTPSLQIPDRFEAMVRTASGAEIRSIILPVREGLEVVDDCYDDMVSAGRGAFLILVGDSGSGKSTLLHTLGLFREGVSTISIMPSETIRDSLDDLPPVAGGLRVVVIEHREALAAATPEELETALHAINRFVRSAAGARTLVVWPCNAQPLVDRLVNLAQQIGADALLGVRAPYFVYHGPPREQYLTIAKKTIETLNSGASLANLGISEERAAQMAQEARTIGQFLNQLRAEARRNRAAFLNRLGERGQSRVWVVVAGGNDPGGEVAALTRGVFSSADIDRLLSATEANVVQSLKAYPEKMGLLGTLFDAKIIHLPVLTALAVVRDFADDPLRERLQTEGLLEGPTGEGAPRLLESELAAAFHGKGSGLLRPGRKPGAAQLAAFQRLTEIAARDDGSLNRALGRALEHCQLIRSFQAEVDVGGGLARTSDLLCQTESDPVRLEVMWRAKTSRAEIANYVLTKLYNYGRAIGFLNEL